MIGAFESMVRRCPHRTCFTYVDDKGERKTYSYRETRMVSAAIARLLRNQGVQRGDSVVVDLPNRPAFIFLILAAAYGGFSLAILNHRLTDSEKLFRQLELERRSGTRVALCIGDEQADALIKRALAQLTGEPETKQQGAARPSFASRANISAPPRSTRALGRVTSGREARRRRDELARQDAVEELIHFAEHAGHLFDRSDRALVMFTSGTTGRPKAVQLTWDNLCRSAEASNAMLNRVGEGLWQAVLPLFHIGGFQVVVRSLLNQCPFILYEKFDAARLLDDVERAGATHVSVVDKMLQDMLAADAAGVIGRYICILLGGSASNPATLDRALEAGARVYMSYGMTETASQVAHAQVTPSFMGGLRLLPGYKVHIVDPGEDGFGRLAVRGPGVFGGYLNARAALTVDGYFLTGDTAAYRDGRLYVKERTSDMFVSGGENVYPAEIRDKILRAPGVADAYVYGVPDATWGRRPVAFVERDPSARGSVPQLFAASVRASLDPLLSRLYLPRHVCVLDPFPRTGIGKTDRVALEQRYDQRIEVQRVVLYRIRLPFTHPFRTAKGTLTYRESLIVEVVDHAGRTGLGECVAFPTDWYLPETLDQDARVLHDVLAPLVCSEVFLHPGEAHAVLSAHPEAAAYPLARGAIEPALWDLYGKIVGEPLWKLIGGEAPADAGETVCVPAGAVIGIGSVEESVEAARRCVEAGYRRIKMKVSPGNGLPAVRAVRAALPHVMLTLDANQSFTEHDADELHALDECGAAWLEEPLDPRRRGSAGGRASLFERLSHLQRTMRTPLCLDESIVTQRDLERALGYANLRCYAVKVGKFGGVQPSLAFVRAARERGIAVWMGGMYDTGVSKRLHAAFETVPSVDAPGDIGATARYFASDVTDPPYTAERGLVTLNRTGNEHGLGCTLNRSALANVLVDRAVIGR